MKNDALKENNAASAMGMPTRQRKKTKIWKCKLGGGSGEEKSETDLEGWYCLAEECLL